MNKIALFNQPAGIGDIFFLQKAARHLMSCGHDVIWPIIPQFMYIKQYIKDIHFVNENEDFPHKEIYKTSESIIQPNFLYFAFDGCHIPLGVELMKAKYYLMRKMGFDISQDDWKDYLFFERNHEREEACRRILGLDGDQKFIFVNNMFGSPPDIMMRDMELSTNLKVIIHRPEHIGMFNVFDFCWILENAEEIHTVETSMCYLIEKLNTKGKLNMYSRKIHGRQQHSDFSYVGGVYNKDWKYHT
jgi:hypothetical protein